MLLFGPQDITIRHEPEDGYLEEYRAALVGENVVVEATFHNPATSSNRDWSHGFLFRATNFRDDYYVVTINGDGKWRYENRADDPDLRVELELESSHIKTGTGEKNVLRIVTVEDKGWVYVNGKYQGEMDLKAIGAGGGVRAIVIDKETGETRVDGFTVWKWGEALAEQLPEVEAPITHGTSW